MYNCSRTQLNGRRRKQKSLQCYKERSMKEQEWSSTTTIKDDPVSSCSIGNYTVISISLLVKCERKCSVKNDQAYCLNIHSELAGQHTLYPPSTLWVELPKEGKILCKKQVKLERAVYPQGRVRDRRSCSPRSLF
jgi:hypothetical protein